jgi:hypothetical protein
MTDSTQLEHPPEALPASPLPADVERVCAYAWQHAATETIVFHGAAQLTTPVNCTGAAVPLNLEAGVWLLARWADLTLDDIPDGELVCVLREALQRDLPEALHEGPPEEHSEALPEDAA